jgi:hypothetical protein
MPLLHNKRRGEIVLSLAAALKSHGLPSDKYRAVRGSAAVALLLQSSSDDPEGLEILLNKRSMLVRQGGDLCCPGGRIHPVLDRMLGAVFLFPGSPLRRGPGWRWMGLRGLDVATLWACSMREAREEMGIHPWNVMFLGLLSPYRLQIFQKDILPVVGLLTRPQKFRINWEVERVVTIPVRSLLEISSYFVYQIEDYPHRDNNPKCVPSFLCQTAHGPEILWGATYHIVMEFLQRVYGFREPPLGDRKTVKGRLSKDYFRVPAREGFGPGNGKDH